MSAADSPTTTKIRRDGWTTERQLSFLDALVSSRNVGKAATFSGMTRESAYRLRNRRDGVLFAALWDRALAGHTPIFAESHNRQLSDGALARLLGPHFRRDRGDYARFIARRENEAPSAST
jgi:hypothetical protein